MRASSTGPAIASSPCCRCTARCANSPRGLVPAGDPFPVQVGPTTELAQLFRVMGAGPGPEVYAIAHPHFYDRPGIYGDSSGDYPDNARRFAFFCWPHSRRCRGSSRAPRSCMPTTGTPRWRPLYSPHHARATARGAAGAHRALGAQRRIPGPLPASMVPDVGLPWEVFTHHCLEWYGRINMLKGGLAFADMVVTVSAEARGRAAHRRGRFRAPGSRSRGSDRFVGITNGIDQRVWDPASDPQHHGELHRRAPRAQGTLQGGAAAAFGLPQRRRIRSSRLARASCPAEGTRPHPRELRDLLALDAQFVFLGGGEQRYERTRCRSCARALPEKVACRDRTSAIGWSTGSWRAPTCASCRPCTSRAGSPRCGAALRHAAGGRRVGGIADTVEDGVTGFLFDKYDASALPGRRLPRDGARCRTAGAGRDDAQGDASRLRLGSSDERYRGGISRRCWPHSMSLDFVLTLHSHLPWVLNHGRWPHG